MTPVLYEAPIHHVEGQASLECKYVFTYKGRPLRATITKTLNWMQLWRDRGFAQK